MSFFFSLFSSSLSLLSLSFSLLSLFFFSSQKTQQTKKKQKKTTHLPDHIHDVGRDHRLVVLAPRHLAQVEQVPDHRHQEAVLLVLGHRPRDRADGPAQRVEAAPRPVVLRRELRAQGVVHLALGVLVVEVGEVDEGLVHRLVPGQGVGVLFFFFFFHFDFAVAVGKK